MFLANSEICNSKKNKISKKQEAQGLLSKIGQIRTLGPLLI